MSTKSRFAKIRFSPDEYKTIACKADEAGITMSEYVRSALTTVHHALDVRAELAALRGLFAIQSKTVGAGVFDAEPMTVEVLLLVRELAAVRDAQLVARVHQRMNVLYPGRSKKL